MGTKKKDLKKIERDLFKIWGKAKGYLKKKQLMSH